MIEELDLKRLNFNKYLRDNIDKFILAFSMFYGEDNANELRNKLNNTTIIGYQSIDELNTLINDLEKKYTNKFISKEIDHLNIDKEYYFTKNPSFKYNMPIKIFLDYYQLELLGIDGRREKFIQEGYNYLRSLNIDISLDEYKEYLNGKVLPNYLKRNDILYYMNINNSENKYNLSKNNFYKEFKIDNSIDFMKSDKLNEFIMISECYKRALNQYNEYSKEISDYKDYVDKSNKLKNMLQKKYYKEYIERCSIIFNQEEIEEIDKYLDGKIYASPECLKRLSNYSFTCESLINNFSDEIQIKLDSDKTSNWLKDIIKNNRITYFKSMGIDLGNDYNNYLNNEDVKKIWPKNELVAEIEKIRLECNDKFNKEFNTSIGEYKEIREEIDKKNLLDKDDTVDASFYIKKGTYISPNIKNGLYGYEFAPIMAIYNNNDSFQYIDHLIVHELNHIYEGIVNGVSNGNIKYLSGWDYTDGKITNEVVEKDTNKSNQVLREYELFNEAINELISQEISQLMKDNKIEVFNNLENAKYKGYASYEKSFCLIRKFYEEFKEDIILSRKDGNIERIFDTIGKENFEELNNLVKLFNEQYDEKRYLSLLEDIDNKRIDSENIKDYNEFIIRSEEILNNMRNYKRNNFSK